MTIVETLRKLGETSSSLEKVKILKETKSSNLETIFRLAYHPDITFGTVKVDLLKNVILDLQVDEENWIKKLVNLLSKLQNRELTGNTARDKIIEFIINWCNIEYADIVLNILNKDLRIGAGAKLINKVYPGLIPEDFCMLASKYNEKKLSFPCYVDFKLDGIRCISKFENDSPSLFSRNGKKLNNYKTIEEELRMLKLYLKDSDNFSLDGELTSGHFQDMMRTVSRKDNGIEMGKDVIYNIFDIIWSNPNNFNLGKRLIFLNTLAGVIKILKLTHIKVNRGKDVSNWKEIEEYYKEALNNGFEGVMIKDLNAIYENRRSTAWMKLKPEETEDLKVIGVEEGTGKYIGKLGALICQLSNGGSVSVGSGFKDDERKDYWNSKDVIIGKIIEIKFQEKTKDGSLRFPVFVRWRDDK